MCDGCVCVRRRRRRPQKCVCSHFSAVNCSFGLKIGHMMYFYVCPTILQGFLKNIQNSWIEIMKTFKTHRSDTYYLQ